MAVSHDGGTLIIFAPQGILNETSCAAEPGHAGRTLDSHRISGKPATASGAGQGRHSVRCSARPLRAFDLQGVVAVRQALKHVPVGDGTGAAELAVGAESVAEQQVTGSRDQVGRWKPREVAVDGRDHDIVGPQITGVQGGAGRRQSFPGDQGVIDALVGVPSVAGLGDLARRRQAGRRRPSARPRSHRLSRLGRDALGRADSRYSKPE